MGKGGAGGLRSFPRRFKNSAGSPIFGYLGVIEERLDYKLLTGLAREFGHASIVMVGPLAKVEATSLPRLPNIHWLGQRSYADLPALVKSFDVCLMPFALNDATRYINPTKTLEYMAAGKPIVSTAIPDVVHNFTPIVRIAYSSNEFNQAVKGAYANANKSLIGQGIARAANSSWSSIVRQMRGHLLEVLKQPAGKRRSSIQMAHRTAFDESHPSAQTAKSHVSSASSRARSDQMRPSR